MTTGRGQVFGVKVGGVLPPPSFSCERFAKCIDIMFIHLHKLGMDFEWDEEKRADNMAKHRVDFTDVLPAFEDEYCIVKEDTRYSYIERRYNVVGKVGGDIVNVTFTYRGADIVRIISARPAHRKERKEYGARTYDPR